MIASARAARAVVPRSTVAALIASASALCGCASTPAPAPQLPSRTVSIEMQTPDPGWRLEITEATLVRGKLWVLAELSRRGGPAAQVISSARDTKTVSAPADAPVQRFVIGKTWGWGDEDSDIRFIESRREIQDELNAGLRVYP